MAVTLPPGRRRLLARMLDPSRSPRSGARRAHVAQPNESQLGLMVLRSTHGTRWTHTPKVEATSCALLRGLLSRRCRVLLLFAACGIAFVRLIDDMAEPWGSCRVRDVLTRIGVELLG